MSKRAVISLAMVWVVLIVAVVSTAITLALCGVMRSDANGSAGAHEVVVTEEEYATISRYARLDEVLKLVEEKYYLETDEDALVLGAINGMLDSLGDPYTYYYTPEDMSDYREKEEGVYAGVSLQLLSDGSGSLLITRVFANSPAKKAGIRAGDVLIEIAGTSLVDLGAQSLTTASELARGELGTTVDVTVLRDSERLTFTLMRAFFSVNRVDYAMLENNIGYIAVYEFQGDVVEGFFEALEALTEQGALGLIVDLRSNPGGSLDDVVDIADMLLPEGLIVYMEDRYGARESYYSEAGAVELPFVVLVNEASASASEVLAGAIQDYDAGLIVGQTTFGKGIVQTILPFSADGAGVKITTARYFTPLGRSIHGTGVTPDIILEQAEDDEINSESPVPARDTQLRRAIEELLAQIDGESAQ